MARIDPARLSRRLMLERPEATPDGMGGELPGFVSLEPVWAMIEPVEGTGEERDGRLVAVTRARLTIRHRGDVRPGWRLTGEGRRFVVTAILDPDASRRHLVLSAEETS